MIGNIFKFLRGDVASSSSNKKKNSNQEGEVIIQKGKKNKSNTDKLGEYIEYEEVK